MLDKILNYIKDTHPTYNQIISFFGIDNEIINKNLLELEEQGFIDKIKNEYYLTSQLNLVPATIVSIKEKFAFGNVSEDEDCYIAIQNLKNAFLDDRVLLKKISNAYEKDEYEVIKVTKRARKELVGEVKLYGSSKILLIDKIAQPSFLFLLNEGKFSVHNGQIVRAKIKKITSQSAVLDVIEILGDKTDVGMDVARIILFNNAPLNFPSEVIEEIKNIPSEVHQEDLINREDYRDHLIVTIDGEDAKDFDDAVEVCKVDDIYYVGVHIADVSYYVKENSNIDKEALNRATSLYVRDRVVPMLPFELSNGICSLNPHVDRLVTSCLFSIDEQGHILTTHICKGVIYSKHRLTYTYVNEFLNKTRYEKTEYNDLEKMLISLQEVSSIIRKQREKNGGLDLSSTELNFVLDQEGTPLEVKKRVQDVGEKLIEDLMIKANEEVASTIEKMDLPMVYRIHENPKAKKLETFMRISLAKGYPLSVDPLKVTPLEISKYLNNIEEKDKKILSSLLLRCLAKAKYSIQNKKHFGLASKSYTHFTSPIRRYPDLIVHRLINKYIVNNNKTCSDEEKTHLATEAQLCSTRERRALVIERTVESLLSCKYMMNYLGNEFVSTIVSMSNAGLFVEIENGIQGLIPFESIYGDYFIFDEETYRAYGVRKGKEFHLGDEVKVICTNVDLQKYQITFALLNKMKMNKRENHGKRRNKNHRK